MRVFTRSIPSRTAPSRPRRIQKGAGAARRPAPTATLARISTRRPTLPEGAAASAEADDEARRPFTALSQVHADFALARVPQEQEWAYMMLRMNGGGEASDYRSSEAGSYEHEEELDHHLRVHHQEHPGGVDGDGDDDLKDEGEGKGKGEDELSEALRRASTRRRGSIRTWSQSYTLQSTRAGGGACRGSHKRRRHVICRVEFVGGESLVALPCKHSYHLALISGFK